ncbi:MAG: HlyC/CorC family transporter [Burkholderiales bacterium]|nr:HlyC/CorC family transporter [Anaerolineae bacterium]
MIEGSLSGLLAIIVLIALHALIALAYAALTNTRRPELRERVDNNDQLHITYELSIVLVRFAIAAVAGLSLAQPLAESNPLLPPALDYIVVLILTALVTVIFGELVPSAIDNVRADTLAPSLLVVMRMLVLILRPFVWLVFSVSRLFTSAFGGSQLVNVITEEEIMTLLDASQKEGSIEEDEREMLYSVLQFDETLAREVMIPRIDVVALEINTPFDDALATFVKSGHSRIPIYDETVDNVKGVLYAKDLLMLALKNRGVNTSPMAIGALMRPAHFVPENMAADRLLKDLKSRRVHMAVVVDEYGGTAGLVTIEDLLEEIVGEIQDEHDPDEEAEYIQLGPDEFAVDAGMNLDDFNDLLDVELPNEDSDTLGGFIYTQLGHVPEAGELVETETLTMRVASVDRQRILKVHVIRKEKPVEATEPSRDPVMPPNGVRTDTRPLRDDSAPTSSAYPAQSLSDA